MKRTATLALAFIASLAVGCDDDSAPTSDGGRSVDMAIPQRPAPMARFAVIGDYGVDTPDEMDVARLIKNWRPEYIVTVGDNNYPNGAADTIDANIGQYFHEFIGAYSGKYGLGSADNRFWPVLGNHDWYSTTGANPYLAYFSSLPGNRRYYDVAIGSVHFFAVDSDAHEPDGIDAGSPQARWLQSRLAASHACFNIVVFHHPPYSSGDPGFVEPRMRWPFRAWGADLVVTGHQHLYERLEIGAMTYIIDGLGGALNRFAFGAVQPGSLVRYNQTFGALFVEVYDDRLEVTFRNTHGDVVDRFDYLRDCTAPHTLADGGASSEVAR